MGHRKNDKAHDIALDREDLFSYQAKQQEVLTEKITMEISILTSPSLTKTDIRNGFDNMAQTNLTTLLELE